MCLHVFEVVNGVWVCEVYWCRCVLLLFCQSTLGETVATYRAYYHQIGSEWKIPYPSCVWSALGNVCQMKSASLFPLVKHRYLPVLSLLGQIVLKVGFQTTQWALRYWPLYLWVLRWFQDIKNINTVFNAISNLQSHTVRNSTVKIHFIQHNLEYFDARYYYKHYYDLLWTVGILDCLCDNLGIPAWIVWEPLSDLCP